MIRRFIHISLWLSAAALLCLAYGFMVEPTLLKVRHVDIPSPHWHGPPLRIAIAADIHMAGHHITEERVQKLTEAINTEHPDIILLAGDYVNGHVPRAQHNHAFNQRLERSLRRLKPLSAPLGTYAVIGNHDAWYDSVYITKQLTDAGITVLENETVTLKNGAVCIVGLEDEWTGKPKLETFEACPKTANIISLMHSPDSFDKLPPRAAFVTAGHTHGGQINIPGIGRRVTSTRGGQKYAYGYIDINGSPAFVTAGIGMSMIPARFRAPPEIVIITLRSQ